MLQVSRPCSEVAPQKLECTSNGEEQREEGNGKGSEGRERAVTVPPQGVANPPAWS
jgi:hypothetical protein